MEQHLKVLPGVLAPDSTVFYGYALPIGVKAIQLGLFPQCREHSVEIRENAENTRFKLMLYHKNYL